MPTPAITTPRTTPRSTLLALTALAALGLAADRPAAAQGLNGQLVGVTERAPTKTATVASDGIKIITPTGALYSDSFLTTTVTPTQITFFDPSPGTVLFIFNGAGSFNGLVISEVGPSPTTITGFSVDPATTLVGFDASRVTFDSTNVFTDLQTLTFSQGQNVTLNLRFSPAAVPEASTTTSFGLLLALGMGGLMVAAKRKKTNGKAASSL